MDLLKTSDDAVDGTDLARDVRNWWAALSVLVKSWAF
jgi:hypothetical protein